MSNTDLKTVWVGHIDHATQYYIPVIFANRELAEKWFDQQLRRFEIGKDDGEIYKSKEIISYSDYDPWDNICSIEVFESKVFDKEEDFHEEYS